MEIKNSKLFMNISIGIVALSIALLLPYYLLIFSPKVKLANTQYAEKLAYDSWQENKINEDTKMVEKDLQERWKDKDTRFNDFLTFRGDSEKTFVMVNGKVLESPNFGITNREAQLNSLVEDEKDTKKKEIMIELGKKHSDWLANYIYWISRNQIYEGMTDDMVKVSFGDPAKVVIMPDYFIWWYWTGNDKKTRDLLVFSKERKLLMIYKDL